MADSGTGQQIVFIDSTVPDLQELLDGLKPGEQAFVLDPDSDGLQQIAAILAANNLTDLAAISLVGEGGAGQIQLGSLLLNADSLPGDGAALAQIGAALQPGGTLQLYGCDVAQGAGGLAFPQQISQAAGGVEVAAASHLVGAAAEGGDWSLDVEAGGAASSAAPATPSTNDISSPFTAAALTAYPDVLASTANRLFTTFSFDVGSPLMRVEQLSVNGALVESAGDIVDGGQNSSLAMLQGIAVDAPRNEYFVVNSDGFTVNKILAGSFSGGALTPLYVTPDINDYELGGLALDQPNGELYFAQDSFLPGQTGIYRIGVSGSAPATEVIRVSDTAAPVGLALDTANNLVFFADLNNNDVDVGNLSTGAVIVLNAQFSQAIQNDLITARLADIAVDAATQTLYFTTQGAGITADNLILSVHYTVTGSAVTLGAVTTLYSGAGAGDPGPIAIDPQDGIFYVGDDANQAIDVGSLTNSGAGAVAPVYQLSTTAGADPQGLFLLSAPVVTPHGPATFTQGKPPITLDSAVAVSSQDGEDLVSATIQVMAGTSGDGDTLTVAPAFLAGTAIGESYDASTETLTLTGMDTLGHYQAVLRNVTFTSTATGPVSRTIEWTVSDGIISSSTVTETVNIVACYCRGTLIRTGRGQKRIERLKIGDSIITRSGRARPIKWIGRRHYGGRFIRGRKDILPVCIKAGALAAGVPRRDLWVSPHHAMYFDDGGGVLIEAKALLNGVSIMQAEAVERVEYFHIELDSHDVIIAEGAPSETFIDEDSRGIFHNAHEYAALYPDDATAYAQYCAPRREEGYEIEAVRQRIASRASLFRGAEARQRAGHVPQVTVHRRAARR